ncbi:hypothetical protein [Tahibacter sp.]|uniref:hypothetical protein n=1 Tax=Tahibacter sp. TaxID=2056211 RepID=UPI0028C39441|nr:hypothetical protein [Tahibacter sp.]
MKRIAFILLATLPASAFAQSVLLGKNLVDKGTRAADVRGFAGEPAQLDRIDGDEFSPSMEIWTYRYDDKVVSLWLVDGAVVKAAEQRSASAGGASSGRSVKAQ